ncbi:hypothetical protein IX53_04540 [Kosmotoga pacifica]|uniref:DUF4258 domain-containing protein n=1 Tax=Kosmotoga pacifica TaxID=1330330 RepID=A0A0G2Z6H3_9BACT|nr:hypothetical protein IX53_04540 [Kosmotoga pacifica]
MSVFFIIVALIILALVLERSPRKHSRTREQKIDLGNIRFTPHALQRLNERGISTETVINVISDPSSQATIEENGNIRVQKAGLVIIFRKEINGILVVTVFRDENKK